MHIIYMQSHVHVYVHVHAKHLENIAIHCNVQTVVEL